MDDNEKLNTLPPWLKEYYRVFKFLHINEIKVIYKGEVWDCTFDV